MAHRTKISLDFPAQFYIDTLIEIDALGMPAATGIAVTEAEFLEAAPDGVDFILRDADYIGHYFHYVELHLMIMALIYGYWRKKEFLVRKIFIGNQNWSPSSQNNAQANLVRHTMPETRIIKEKGGKSKACVVLDREIATHSSLNKFVEPAEDVLPMAVSAIRRLVMASIGSHNGIRSRDQRPLVLYVTRKPPRSLSEEHLNKVEEIFIEENFRFLSIDYSNMSFKDQVIQSSTADVIVGVHGNGLTNCLWLKSNSALIEIFPPKCHHYDYQLLAEAGMMKYFGLEGVAEKGFVYTGGSRFGGAYGSPNDHSIHDLPWQRLRLIAQELRRQISRKKR